MPKLLFLVVLLLSCLFVRAQGCLVGTSLNINGTNVNYKYLGIFDSGIEIYNQPYSTISTDCPRANRSGAALGLCYVGGTLGFLYNYTLITPPLGCPIDDYVPVIFIFTTGIATYSLRKTWQHSVV